jgi:hypothetical protein
MIEYKVNKVEQHADFYHHRKNPFVSIFIKKKGKSFKEVLEEVLRQYGKV